MFLRNIKKSIPLALCFFTLASCTAKVGFNTQIKENSKVNVSYKQRIVGPDHVLSDKTTVIKDKLNKYDLELNFGQNKEYEATNEDNEVIKVSSPVLNEVKLLETSTYLKPINYSINDSDSFYTQKTVDYFEENCKNDILNAFKGKTAFELYSYTAINNRDSYFTSDAFYDAKFSIPQLSYETIFGDKYESFEEVNNLKSVVNAFTCGIYNTIFTYVGFSK